MSNVAQMGKGLNPGPRGSGGLGNSLLLWSYDKSSQYIFYSFHIILFFIV